MRISNIGCQKLNSDTAQSEIYVYDIDLQTKQWKYLD